MTLRKLESLLQVVETFEEPKITLEQYPTSPHLAAQMLFNAQQLHDDIENRVVIDLGCGTGMLSIAAALLGAKKVIAFDVDKDALKIASQNIKQCDVDDVIELRILDLSTGLLTEDSTPGNEIITVSEELDWDQIRHGLDLPIVDTVIMNPPFGTRCAGIDLHFVKLGLSMAKRSIYSLHKTSTRTGILRRATKYWRCTPEVIAELRFDIPRMYDFHSAATSDVEVDLIRFPSVIETTMDDLSTPKIGGILFSTDVEEIANLARNDVDTNTDSDVDTNTTTSESENDVHATTDGDFSGFDRRMFRRGARGGKPGHRNTKGNVRGGIRNGSDQRAGKTRGGKSTKCNRRR